MLSFLLGFAFADEIADEFQKAKDAIKSEQYSEMSKSLKKVKKLAAKSERLLTQEEVSDIWFLEGLSHLKRKDSTTAIQFFRLSLIVFPKRSFTNEYVNNDEDEEFFLSIQSEIEYRK